MNRKIVVWIPAVLFLFTLSLAANSAASASEPAHSGIKPTSTSNLRPGQAATHKPEQQFQAAREDFLKKDMKAAAAEIRKGAAFMEREAYRATGEGRQALMASVGELKKLAKDVENGTVRSAQELDEVFARAHQAQLQHRPKSA